MECVEGGERQTEKVSEGGGQKDGRKDEQEGQMGE